MFEQTQIQEFKEAFTIMDQNRDGFIDKADLRDTFAALGRLNVKNEELEDMVKEAPGPINFTVFLTMFGEKLKEFQELAKPLALPVLWPKSRASTGSQRNTSRLLNYISLILGTDPEETILNAFKIFDPEGKGRIKADYIKEMLMTQADRFSQEEINQMFAAFPPDVSGNLDYKNLCYVITHEQALASSSKDLNQAESAMVVTELNAWKNNTGVNQVLKQYNVARDRPEATSDDVLGLNDFLEEVTPPLMTMLVAKFTK
ncbi:Myosin regulatory light chain 2B, cardiac muscle isoform [Lonchura striata]|uniref:Myosin regulatory light chain 2B, cardiac muscle isoform n=1 Tax=Lonchura striata TaxID=40157 RepID=A0A218V2A9_9PASE|nr:Myosin regulatory light chain 2B, cardiac muscle isoform [Lonchura striata domestica]